MRIPNRIQAALDNCVKPVEIVRGRKHVHIRIGGKLAGVCTSGGQSGREWKVENLICAIRRADRAPA